MNYGRVNSGSERLDATLQQKTFTPDRFPFDKHATTYGIDGFSEVIINAPENFSAENIKKDVTIAGVTGTYEGSGSGGADAEAMFWKTLITSNSLTEPANAPAGLIKSNTIKKWPENVYVGPDGLDLSNITSTYSLEMKKVNQYYRGKRLDEAGGPIKLGNVPIVMSGSELMGLPEGEWTLTAGSFSSCKFTTDIVITESHVPGGDIPGGSLGSLSKTVLNTYETNPLTLTLPANITKIPNYSVSGYGTAKLNLVMLATTPPTLSGSNSISNTNSITVPAGTLEAYQTATNWSQFTDIMVEATTETTEA